MCLITLYSVTQIPMSSKMDGDGMDGVPEENNSSNNDDTELPTTAPVAPYNDVRSDPYLVMR